MSLFQELLHEATVLNKYDHPSIVKLKGLIVRRKPIMVLLEYMDGGSLDKHLHKLKVL